MTIAVQLAFQGGGARLSAFFPAIMALQELERAGVIAVKRVSGASAGAIAAALFAGRANIPALIEFCKGLEAKKDLMNQVFPKIDYSTMGGKAGIAMNVARHKPFGDEAALAKILGDAFSAARISATTIGSLSIPCYITSANLVHHQANVASNDKQIIQCLIESAALPFFFRMAGETFDGGVLDNLPIDALRIDSKLETEFGEIVAVGFRQSSYAEPVTSPYRLGLRLLESSINARTAYSKALLGEDRVVELPITFDQVTLSTFDLNSFFAVCKSTSIQSQIEVGVSNWFKAYSEKRANPEKITVVADSAINEAHDHAKIVASQSAKLRQLASIYHGRSNVRFATTLLEVTANSLKSVNPGEDRFDYQDDFYIGDEPVFSHVTRLFASNSGHVSQNQLLVYDDQGEEIPSVTFSVPDDVGDHNWILALFGKPIMPTAERRKYTLLSKQHSGNSMRPIVEKGHDYLAIQLSQAESADCAEIRLFVPEEIELIMQNGTQELLAACKIVEEKVEEGEKLVVGKDCSNDPAVKRSCPPDFRAYVWRAEGLARGDVLRVVYSKK